jgi:hypothetical protein
MKINFKTLTPILLIGVIASMIVVSNWNTLTPEQVKVMKENEIKKELSTLIQPTKANQELTKNELILDSPITKKIEQVSKNEIQTYKSEGEFDIRAKIAGTNKDLPFKNIATVDWIDSGKALVVAYDTLKDLTGKNFIYKINPDDKEQGVYIYDINTG